MKERNNGESSEPSISDNSSIIQVESNNEEVRDIIRSDDGETTECRIEIVKSPME